MLLALPFIQQTGLALRQACDRVSARTKCPLATSFRSYSIRYRRYLSPRVVSVRHAYLAGGDCAAEPIRLGALGGPSGRDRDTHNRAGTDLNNILAEPSAEGLTPADAARRARADFGDVDQVSAGLRDIDQRILTNRARTEWRSAIKDDLRRTARGNNGTLSWWSRRLRRAWRSNGCGTRLHDVLRAAPARRSCPWKSDDASTA
jgi:hypothetical protein